MVSPINYTMNVLNPIEGYLQGLKFGEGILSARQQRAATEQDMRIQQATFEEQQRARAELRAKTAKAQADAEAGKKALFEYFDKQEARTATPSDLRRAILQFPGMADQFQAVAKSFSEERLGNEQKFGKQLSFALARGQTDAARGLLQERLDAATASGDEQTAATYKAQLQQLDASPEGLLMQTLMPLAATMEPDDFDKFYESSLGMGGGDKTEAFRTLDAQLRAGGIVPQAEGGDGRYEAAMQSKAGAGKKATEAVSTIGKIAQDVKNNILPQSVLDTAIRIEEKNAKTDEGLTVQQKIAEEARLRGEYTKRTEDLSSAERNFNIIETSANDQSGAGDIALVTSFMKMLDPGSVVRETEFATAANAGGTLSQLKSTLTKVQNGQFLTPQQREDFKRLSKQYLDAAKQQETQVQSSYQLIVDNYDLNPVNVFGARAVTAQTAAAPAPVVAPAGEPAAAPQEPAPVNFINDPSIKQVAEKYGVSPEDIWNAMTPEQRARYGK